MEEMATLTESKSARNFQHFGEQYVAAKKFLENQPKTERVLFSRPWRETLPTLLPYTETGEENPFSKNHSDSRDNPFWLQTPLQKSLENLQMPFGLSNPRALAEWGIDFTGAVELNNTLLSLFTDLTEKIDPNAIGRLIKTMDTITSEGALIGHANELVNRIWKNIYGSGEENPRSIETPKTSDIIEEIKNDPEKALAYWFTLKTYFSGTMTSCYSSFDEQGLSENPSPDTVMNKMFQDAFMWSYGTQFQKDPTKSRRDLTMSDLTDSGQQQFEQYKGFYQELFSNPFLVVNDTAKYFIDRRQDGARSSIVEGLYKSLSAKALEKFVKEPEKILAPVEEITETIPLELRIQQDTLEYLDKLGNLQPNEVVLAEYKNASEQLAETATTLKRSLVEASGEEPFDKVGEVFNRCSSSLKKLVVAINIEAGKPREKSLAPRELDLHGKDRVIEDRKLFAQVLTHLSQTFCENK